MKKLNSSALQAKLVSVLVLNRSMKAVSKMLTIGFKIVKTENENVFDVVMKNETQTATLFDNRYVVISYAKPKGAKQQVISLNQNVFINSERSVKAIVIDLEEKSINNADIISGFSSTTGSNFVKAMLGGVQMTTVRNYINHTQLYIIQVLGQIVVLDNIKAVRQVLNSEIANVNEIFSPFNMKAFVFDMEMIAG